MINIEKIAHLAGTSRSTVSRVINNDPKVSAEVRERVERIISETGYRPNAAARNLAGKHTRVISLVVPRSPVEAFDDPFYLPLLKGMATAVNARSYSLMLLILDKADPYLQSHLLDSHNADGILLGASLVNNNPYIPYLIERKVPFVSVGRHLYYSNINYVDVDNIGSAQNAVNHLLKLGLRRIATITGSLEVTSGVDRREGYLRALRAAGIEPQTEMMAEGGFSSEQGYVAMCDLLPMRPEAVFVASDTMAVGAYRAIYEAGLSVPDDIAVVGFDDSEQASHLVPSLTTVRQPISELGHAAADLLLDIITGTVNQPVHKMLKSELIVRRSCGSGQPEQRSTPALNASPPVQPVTNVASGSPG